MSSEAASHTLGWSQLDEGRKTLTFMLGGGVIGVTVGAQLENTINPAWAGRDNLQTQIDEATTASVRQPLQEQRDALHYQHIEYAGNAGAIGLLGGLAIRAGYLGIQRLNTVMRQK